MGTRIANESADDTAKRIAWMREHFKLGNKAPFAECHDITQRVFQETADNKAAMQPPVLPLPSRPSLAACDGLVAMAAGLRAKREGRG